MRLRAASVLARWIELDRAVATETDYIILGDMNAEIAKQGLEPFATESGLKLLSVGMRNKYGANALTRVASGRLLDHIVVTSDTVALMPDEDIDEQIIIRSDTRLAEWTAAFSDHVPVAARFVIGKDRD